MRVLIIALILSTFANLAFAEQPAASEYRKILQSGTFYIEYKDANEVKVLAAFDNKRMERINYIKMNWVTFFNPLGALLGGSGSKYPDILYKNGKYYQFIDEDTAIVLDEHNLNDKNLDPRQGWNSIKQKLAIPNELAVFSLDDSYRNSSKAVSAPKFVSSSQKIIDKKVFMCDKYISDIKQSNAGSNTQIIYEIFYEDNKLSEAHLSILQNGIVYPVNKIQIKKLLSEVPKGSFKVDKKTKVYKAGKGDILDLIQQPEQCEILEAI